MNVRQEDLISEMEPFVIETIHRLASSRSLPHQLVQRASIIDLLSKGLKINEVTEKVGLHRNQVGKWRKRFNEALPQINALARDGQLTDCRNLIIKILSDEQRSGRPRRITQEERNCVVATACLKPGSEQIDWPLSHWTSCTLCEYLLETQLIESISPRTVSRILKENKLRPHKQKMWIHSKDKDENFEEFIEQVRQISEMLMQVEEYYSQGIQIISIDEKTGIQAKSPVREDKPIKPGMDEKREVNYIRNGRQDLIQGQNVALGELFRPYIADTHKEADFTEALKICIEEQLEQTPDDEIIILCDNFSSHKSESVTKLIASFLDIDPSSLGIKNIYGVLENMPSREEFLTDPSHRIRFVYTPKHASWLDPIEVYFSILSRDLIDRGSFEDCEEIREKIKAYTQWYNDYRARPFDYKFRQFGETIDNWILSYKEDQLR